MVLEKGKLYKKVGDTYVEISTQDASVPALIDALALNGAGTPNAIAGNFIANLQTNQLSIFNQSNTVPVEGDLRQISTAGSIRFYKYLSGDWDETGGFNGDNLKFMTGNNIGLGYTVLNMNDITTAYDNLGLGYLCLDKLTTGYRNIAIGTSCLRQLTTGYRNIAIGVSALVNQTTAFNNIAIGVAAAQLCQQSSNIAIGSSALGYYIGTLGTGQNIAIGTEALQLRVDGSFNQQVSGCIGIGSGVRVDGDGQIQLGNSLYQTAAYTVSGWTIRSDLRDKTDIREAHLGLDFIRRVPVRSFRYDRRDEYLQKGIEKDGSLKGKRFHVGTIAQEVKQVMDAMGVDFAGYNDPSVTAGGSGEYLGIIYEEFIGPLIKAVQELADKNEELHDRLTKIESQN